MEVHIHLELLYPLVKWIHFDYTRILLKAQGKVELKGKFILVQNILKFMYSFPIAQIFHELFERFHIMTLVSPYSF